MKKKLTGLMALFASLFLVTSCYESDESSVETWHDAPDMAINTNRSDFRKETIYFVLPTRFYDGDTANNVHCWDDAQAKNPDSDPAWRGDFKGLTEKLDYIKALGFTAIWVTPPVKNCSGYDYHGYHAINMMEVDPRFKNTGDASAEASYKKFIDAAHAKGIKVIQDIVYNHSGNFGEENIYPLFRRNAPTGLNDSIASVTKIDTAGRLPANYDSLTPAAQYSARITAMKEDTTDTARIYHHEKSLSWESYTVQTGQIAGDCVDLNTENPTVSSYLVDVSKKFMDLGVDAFRVDTVKHVSRLTFNKAIVPQIKAYGGDNFYIFGEVCTRYRQVWNNNIPAISAPFYTWKESKTYAWGTTATNENSVLLNWNDNSANTFGQPTSNNAYLINNAYHAPDYAMRSGFDVIDFPMHWNFTNARDAFGVAVSSDNVYNDATWNVTYIDSHDYAPDTAPENQRFNQPTDTWAENLSLIFTFRGIPCLFYGSEIEFMKGAPIDVGPNAPLSTTGRAYFGDKITGSVTVTDFAKWTGATGNMATTLNHPLSLHIQRLNLIRRQIPALQMGQYTTDGVSGGGIAFKRRYTASGVDSFVCVTISGDATFTGIPNGTYADAITGGTVSVTNGSLSTSGCTSKGNMRVYVLNGPGKIGNDTNWLKGSGTTPPPNTSSFKVHIKKNTVANWSTFNCYYWASNGSPTANAWPGTAMTAESNNWYVFTVPGTQANIIFNSGSSQTVDLDQSKEAWFVPTGSTDGKITGTWYAANPDSSGTPPTEPTNVSASVASSSQINVSWTAPSGATSYTVYVSTTDTGEFTAAGKPTTNSFSVTGLTASTKYYFKVTASNSYGTSEYSLIANATTSAPQAGLKVHFKVNSVANWTAVNCYYWGSNGSPASNTWPGAAATFEGNGWYVFSIPASTSSNIIFNNGSVQTVDLNRTAEGWFIPTGTSSGKITGTWYSNNPDSALAKPAAPTGLSATAQSATSIKVSWTASSGAASYSIYKSTSASGTYTTDGLVITGTSIVVTDLNPSTTYYFKLTATNAEGTSALSSYVSATTQATPTGLKVHFKKNTVANWTTFNCYYWASNGTTATNTWPGQAMTSEGSDWWVFTIPGATSSNVIFDNGSAQTVDLARTGEGWFVPTGTSGGKITGTWYSTKP